MIKVLITDLDDTLYSWIGFFIPAFYELVDELSIILAESPAELLNEYKKVHQEKGSVEYPYATLYLPAVKKAYPDCSQKELLDILNPAFHKFNSVRKKRLQLYPKVEETFTFLKQQGITIVGYTESAEENGFYRLRKLGIDHLFHKVYVSDSQYVSSKGFPTSTKTQIVHGKKPNPELLKEICNYESVLPNEAIYIGDSLTKDIYMARMAGVTSVLCKYPCNTAEMADWYKKLVAISHWTKEDFDRENQIKQECVTKNIRPDYVIESFDEIISIIDSIG